MTEVAFKLHPHMFIGSEFSLCFLVQKIQKMVSSNSTRNECSPVPVETSLILNQI